MSLGTQRISSKSPPRPRPRQGGEPASCPETAARWREGAGSAACKAPVEAGRERGLLGRKTAPQPVRTLKKCWRRDPGLQERRCGLRGETEAVTVVGRRPAARTAADARPGEAAGSVGASRGPGRRHRCPSRSAGISRNPRPRPRSKAEDRAPAAAPLGKASKPGPTRGTEAYRPVFPRAALKNNPGPHAHARTHSFNCVAVTGDRRGAAPEGHWISRFRAAECCSRGAPWWNRRDRTSTQAGKVLQMPRGDLQSAATDQPLERRATLFREAVRSERSVPLISVQASTWPRNAGTGIRE